QELFSTGSPATRYVVAKADNSPTAYLLAGDYLTRWEQLGGAAGSLGYPTSDGAPGGHQLFSNTNALASTPVRLVSGAILSKWAALNYESGAAGLPLADAANVAASSGTRAQSQTFAKGVIYTETSGSRAGQAQFVSGRILDRYNALGGPPGGF